MINPQPDGPVTLSKSDYMGLFVSIGPFNGLASKANLQEILFEMSLDKSSPLFNGNFTNFKLASHHHRYHTFKMEVEDSLPTQLVERGGGNKRQDRVNRGQPCKLLDPHWFQVLLDIVVLDEYLILLRF